MRQSRSLAFDAMEGRTLLSGAPHAMIHAADVSTPLTLDGTLKVNNAASTVTEDSYGDTTTTIPVSGTIGSMGKVRGAWIQSVDFDGNEDAPDTLRLSNSQGAVVLTFSVEAKTKAIRLSPTTVGLDHPQRLYSGTRAYARSTETGTIQMVTNNAATHVESLTLTSAKPS